MKKITTVDVVVTAAIAAIILLVAYGGWQAKKWWNWKWSYEEHARDEIRNELEPLKKELADLKERMTVLEKRCSQQKSE